MHDFVIGVVNRALAGVDQLPAKERADLYDGVGEILGRCKGMKRKARAARETAEAIRDAEQRQLQFSRLFAEEGLEQDA